MSSHRLLNPLMLSLVGAAKGSEASGEGGGLAPAAERLADLGEAALAWAPVLLLALLVVLVASWIGRWLSARRWVGRLGRGNPYLAAVAARAVRLGVLGLGLLLALELLDLTAVVGALLGAAGVVGIAMGFAFKNIIENHLAGILLSLRQPFAPGDHLCIDGHEGKVVGLTSRATLLMTLDGNHLRIPNSKVFNAVILNYSRNPLRRFDFDLGVGAEDDLLAAQRIGLEAINGVAAICRERAPRSWVVELGDSNVVLRFSAWVDQREHDFLALRSACLIAVKNALESAGLSLPEPQFRLRVEQAAAAVPMPSAAPDNAARAAASAAETAPLEDAAVSEVEADLRAERDQLGESNLLKPGRDE